MSDSGLGLSGLDFDEDAICGTDHDHDLREVDSQDGWSTFECCRCGAEVFAETVEVIGDGETPPEAIE